MARQGVILSNDDESTESMHDERNEGSEKLGNRTRRGDEKTKKVGKRKEKGNTEGNKKEKRLEGKRSSKGVDDPPPVNREFLSAARAITRCVDLWCDIEKVINVATLMEQDEASKAGELQEHKTMRQIHDDRLKALYVLLCLVSRRLNVNDSGDEARQYYLTTYRKILQLTPGLIPLITNHNHSTELAQITQKASFFKMVDIINNTRSIDATKLKSYIAQYVAPEPQKAALNPPIVNINGQDRMGLKHPVLARFICPMEALAGFDADPIESVTHLSYSEDLRTRSRALKLLECGKIPMRADNFPAVFGAVTSIPETPMIPRTRVARHIFLGPTSALDMTLKRDTKSCNAFLHDMTIVEPEHIAYVCVQVSDPVSHLASKCLLVVFQTRFGISSMSCWSEKDGEFSYHELYRLVVSFICNAVDIDWRGDLLKWWNLQLFGNEKGRGFKGDTKSNNTSESSSEPADTGMVDRMKAQMQARVAARAAAASTRPESFSGHMGFLHDGRPPISSDHGARRLHHSTPVQSPQHDKGTPSLYHNEFLFGKSPYHENSHSSSHSHRESPQVLPRRHLQPSTASNDGSQPSPQHHTARRSEGGHFGASDGTPEHAELGTTPNKKDGTSSEVTGKWCAQDELNKGDASCRKRKSKYHCVRR
ncbi:hypothetical protein JVT61DRAFT_3909 [Boletus reticuloceps]|uniref:Uncharacterized protein n=1 Tax=Boletus reticuloceps TaxID=495285 RepID=A0A8I2YLX2_9AGAM|nr:hypothetical protein JVT61DRAFT_3909 [Boletus reticuloceps]